MLIGISQTLGANKVSLNRRFDMKVILSDFMKLIIGTVTGILLLLFILNIVEPKVGRYVYNQNMIIDTTNGDMWIRGSERVVPFDHQLKDLKVKK